MIRATSQLRKLLRLLQCTLLISSGLGLNHTNSVTLLSMLKKSAGIYKDPLRQVGLERTVLVTGCNHGFLNHLHNFKCFCDRIGLKFLVIALDEKSHLHLSRNTDVYAYHMVTDPTSTAPIVEDHSAEFRSDQFNLITTRKKEAVHDILLLGYDVLFSDTDVAIIRDPMPYLLWSNVDYVHSVNIPCSKPFTWKFWGNREEGNTGFYFVRSTVQTIKLWAKVFEAMPTYPGLDDQTVFWKVIRQNSDPRIYPVGTCRNMANVPSNSNFIDYDPDPPLTTCYLDICMFSSGMLSDSRNPQLKYAKLIEGLSFKNEKMVTVHANFIKGNAKKAAQMDHHGFWLVNGTKDSLKKEGFSTACRPFVSV